MKNSNPDRKILASIINCTLVTVISLPIYLVAEPQVWKLSAVILFFAYNLIFRRRCIGMMVAGTYLERPTSVRYAALYTISFSSLFYSWHVPGDLLVANGLLFQLPSLALTGNTAHGLLGGQWTYEHNDHNNSNSNPSRSIGLLVRLEKRRKRNGSIYQGT